MTQEARFNQRIAGTVQPAGKVADGKRLFAWMKSLPKGDFPQTAALLKTGVAKQVDVLERELIKAFLVHEPSSEHRPHVEALLLAVLGREPKANAFGLAEQLPLLSDENDLPAPPLTILERAVRVGQHHWDTWSEERRRREYLLVEFYDAVLTDAAEDNRNERLSASLRLLAKI